MHHRKEQSSPVPLQRTTCKICVPGSENVGDAGAETEWEGAEEYHGAHRPPGCKPEGKKGLGLVAVGGGEPGGEEHVFVGGPHEVYGGGDEGREAQDIERDEAGETDRDDGDAAEENYELLGKGGHGGREGGGMVEVEEGGEWLFV